MLQAPCPQAECGQSDPWAGRESLMVLRPGLPPRDLDSGNPRILWGEAAVLGLPHPASTSWPLPLLLRHPKSAWSLVSCPCCVDAITTYFLMLLVLRGFCSPHLHQAQTRPGPPAWVHLAASPGVTPGIYFTTDPFPPLPHSIR